MKKAILFLALGSAMQLALSCRHTTEDVQPTPVPTVNRQAANYDVLADATGHWQWKSSYQSSPTILANMQRRDSAKVGYGRQLRFRSDSTLLLRRTGRADTLSQYSIVVANMLCSQPSNGKRRTVVYSTKEPSLPINNQKGMLIGSHALLLSEEGTSCGIGWNEYYLWVAEP